MKTRLVGAQLFHEDGWTDKHDEVKSHFLQFWEDDQKRKGVTAHTLRGEA